jgi:hypothetical protein
LLYFVPFGCLTVFLGVYRETHQRFVRFKAVGLEPPPTGADGGAIWP